MIFLRITTGGSALPWDLSDAFLRDLLQGHECVARRGSALLCQHLESLLKTICRTNELQWFDVRECLLHVFQCHRACDMLKVFGEMVFGLVAGFIDDNIVMSSGHGSLTALGSLHRGQKRARNIGKVLKEHIVEKAQSKRFRSSAAVVRGSGSGSSERSGRDVDDDRMRLYFWSVAAAAQGHVRVSVATDASSLGGEDTSFYAAWLPRTNMNMWFIPRVPLQIQPCFHE